MYVDIIASKGFVTQKKVPRALKYETLQNPHKWQYEHIISWKVEKPSIDLQSFPLGKRYIQDTKPEFESKKSFLLRFMMLV